VVEAAGLLDNVNSVYGHGRRQIQGRDAI